MQTKVYSDHEMALWCLTGFCSTPGFLNVYLVLSYDISKEQSEMLPQVLKWFWGCEFHSYFAGSLERKVEAVESLEAIKVKSSN